MLKRPWLAFLVALIPVGGLLVGLALYWVGTIKELKDGLALGASLSLLAISAIYAALTYTLAREAKENVEATRQSVREQQQANEITRHLLALDEKRYRAQEKALLDDQAPPVVIVFQGSVITPTELQVSTMREEGPPYFELVLAFDVDATERSCLVRLPDVWLNLLTAGQGPFHVSPGSAVTRRLRTPMTAERLTAFGSSLPPLDFIVSPLRAGLVEDVYRFSSQPDMSDPRDPKIAPLGPVLHYDRHYLALDSPV